MTANDIIHEIDCLPPAEQAEVVRFTRQLDETRPLSPAELGVLAGQLVEATDPAEVKRIREALVSGFYGRR